ncbi:MAG TPA: A24 family peptidase [Terriglobales bacterium]|nr:A24 family peptidase [Terriglobales bacterium]
MWAAFIIAFVVAVAFSDILWRKVPRHLTVVAFAAGVIFHAVFGGLLSAITAILVASVLGVAFFRVGAIGGGDVKLLIALGAILGLRDWLIAMQIAVFCAAFVALVQVLRRGLFVQTARNLMELIRGIFRNGLRGHETIHVRNPLAVRAPFGFAAAVGTILVVVRP